MIMKITKNVLKYFLMALAITSFTASCQKDNLEDAVLPQTVQGEQSTSGTSGTSGAQGEQGEQGPKGDKGDQGEPGVAGPEGPQGPEGPAGQDGEAIGVPGPKGDTGEPGPAGPKGDTGDTGPAGANGIDGANGADGQDGNANVIASDWFEPKESSFSVNNPAYKGLPLATSIKGKIKDGVILVYYDDDVQVQLLPRYTYSPSGSILTSVDSHINHASNTLYVTIRKYGSDLTPREYLWNPSGAAYSKGVRFRYIIIPNGTSAKNSNINYKKITYHEVMDHFGLSY